MNNRSRNSLLYASAYTIGNYALSFCKLSYLLGSRAAYFSASTVVEPLIGAWSTATTSGLYFIIKTAITALSHVAITPALLGYHIPSFCGSLYFTAQSRSGLHKALFALAPLSCIALFVLNPVGSVVWWYSLIWLVPVATLMFPHNNFWLSALGSTLSTHAVGTVLWLFTHTTTPAFWIALFPIALLERFLLASGMTGVWLAIQHAPALFQNIYRTFQRTARS